MGTNKKTATTEEELNSHSRGVIYSHLGSVMGGFTHPECDLFTLRECDGCVIMGK